MNLKSQNLLIMVTGGSICLLDKINVTITILYMSSIFKV